MTKLRRWLAAVAVLALTTGSAEAAPRAQTAAAKAKATAASKRAAARRLAARQAAARRAATRAAIPAVAVVPRPLPAVPSAVYTAGAAERDADGRASGDGYTQSPGYAPTPAYAPEPSAAYRWLDDADAMVEAIANSPPDFAFSQGSATRNAWRLRDGALVIAVPVDRYDTRLYFYPPDMTVPFLVRDRYYSYAYERGRMIAAFDDSGRTLPWEQAEGRRGDADSLFALGRRLWFAAQSPRDPVADGGIWLSFDFGSQGARWRDNRDWDQWRQGQGYGNWRARRDRYRAERDERRVASGGRPSRATGDSSTGWNRTAPPTGNGYRPTPTAPAAGGRSADGGIPRPGGRRRGGMVEAPPPLAPATVGPAPVAAPTPARGRFQMGADMAERAQAGAVARGENAGRPAGGRPVDTPPAYAPPVEPPAPSIAAAPEPERSPVSESPPIAPVPVAAPAPVAVAPPPAEEPPAPPAPPPEPVAAPAEPAPPPREPTLAEQKQAARALETGTEEPPQ